MKVLQNAYRFKQRLLSMQNNLIQDVKDRAECLVSADQLKVIVDAMAQTITQVLADKNPVVLIVMKGGLIFAGQLLTNLNFPLEVDYLHATRYANQLSGTHLVWKAKPDVSVVGRHVLVVDDILDEGATLVGILEDLKTQGAAQIYTAVLINKQHQRKALPHWLPDFVGMELADRYLFGFGMDYKGYWRNANGIYAAADEDVN